MRTVFLAEGHAGNVKTLGHPGEVEIRIPLTAAR